MKVTEILMQERRSRHNGKPAGGKLVVFLCCCTDGAGKVTVRDHDLIPNHRHQVRDRG